MKKFFRIAILLLCLFVLVGVTLAFLRPSSKITRQQAKERYSLPESHFIEWRGGDVHYVDEGSGYPVLMIHGLAGSHRNFGKIAERLKGDYRVIRVDLPGFGLSDFPKVADEDYKKMYEDFFAFFLDTLQLDSFYLMGNSMGGWMSWELAARYPERVTRLFLLCSAGYDMQQIAAKLRGMDISPGLVDAITAKGIPYFFTENIVGNCFADPSKVSPEEVEIANAFTNREKNFQTIMTLLRHRNNADTTVLKNIQCPTLIVWGKQDNIIPFSHSNRFHRDIPNNKLIVYDNCGHIPMVENVEQFEKDFRAFVAETIHSSVVQGADTSN